jgi:hypothetical protein
VGVNAQSVHHQQAFWSQSVFAKMAAALVANIRAATRGMNATSSL